MKRTFFIICMSVMAISIQSCKTTESHTSRNSLDWMGIYKGIFATEDGKETMTTLELKEDMTYQMQLMPVNGNEISSTEGKFSWNKKGNQITLTDKVNHIKTTYQVQENRLVKMDEKAKKIEASAIALHKVDNNTITEKYWKLIELNGKPVKMDEKSTKEAHIILKTEENRIVGTSGCNSFHGTYTLGNRPGSISFSKLASTMMACLNMDIERDMFDMFEAVDNYTISADGKFLSLNKARMAPLARFEVVYLR